MNTEQEQHLEKIFRDNQNQGIAIAITGYWGVGKTFAWNRFLQEKAKLEEEKIKHEPAYKRKIESRIFSKKYAYISLFGIESLSDLKAAISTNMSSNYFNKESSQNFEIPTFVKKGLSALRDVKISGNGEGFGINSSAKIFEAVLYSQVKDAIICFDDFERMSRKLDIQDVMGLANQLKLERNCQVVLILDESRTEGENQKKYADYKEKLIDETIKITSVEPLIREKAKEIEPKLVDLMVQFANELEIHNFRFFQKVIKLYKQFKEQLPPQIADSTKEIILIRILQGYFIEDFGKTYEFDWEDIKLVLDEKQIDWSERKRETYESLKLIDYSFIHSDDWLIEFKKWFDQIGEPDITKLHELANSELISEKNNQIRDNLDILMKEWRNLAVDETFCERLYENSIKRIGYETLQNLDFYCDLLKEFDRSDLAKKLELKIKSWIEEQYDTKGVHFVSLQFNSGFEIKNQFHVYLSELKNLKPNQGLPNLVEVVYRYAEHSGWNSNTDPKVLEVATKQDWHNLIFVDFENDERFKGANKLRLLKIILKQQISIELQSKINDLIFELLQDEAQISSLERRKNIEYVIKKLKE